MFFVQQVEPAALMLGSCDFVGGFNFSFNVFHCPGKIEERPAALVLGSCDFFGGFNGFIDDVSNRL